METQASNAQITACRWRQQSDPEAYYKSVPHHVHETEQRTLLRRVDPTARSSQTIGIHHHHTTTATHPPSTLAAPHHTFPSSPSHHTNPRLYAHISARRHHSMPMKATERPTETRQHTTSPYHTMCTKYNKAHHCAAWTPQRKLIHYCRHSRRASPNLPIHIASTNPSPPLPPYNLAYVHESTSLTCPPVLRTLSLGPITLTGTPTRTLFSAAVDSFLRKRSPILATSGNSRWPSSAAIALGTADIRATCNTNDHTQRLTCRHGNPSVQRTNHSMPMEATELPGSTLQVRTTPCARDTATHTTAPRGPHSATSHTIRIHPLPHHHDTSSKHSRRASPTCPSTLISTHPSPHHPSYTPRMCMRAHR
jgi:hypothetical protein